MKKVITILERTSEILLPILGVISVLGGLIYLVYYAFNWDLAVSSGGIYALPAYILVFLICAMGCGLVWSGRWLRRKRLKG